jgi:phosphoribosylformylglycinamidine synthase
VKIRVHITPRRGVLDPQGQAVAGGLKSLGFSAAGDVRVGKVVDIELTDVADEATALAMGRAMAEKLLANDIVEDFDVHVLS